MKTKDQNKGWRQKSHGHGITQKVFCNITLLLTKLRLYLVKYINFSFNGVLSISKNKK